MKKEKIPLSKKKIFTTGEAATICKLSLQTIVRLFDSGELEGFKVPGSRHRRIPRESLIKLLKDNGMPLGDLEDGDVTKVLIMAQDQVLIENIKRELQNLSSSFKVAVANSSFEAGMQAESSHPDCVIVDFQIGKVEAIQICQNLRRNTVFANTILIALLPDDGNSISFDRSTVNETFKKPFDAALLADQLRELIGAEKELV